MNLSLRPVAGLARRVTASVLALQPVAAVRAIAVIVAGARPGAPVS